MDNSHADELRLAIEHIHGRSYYAGLAMQALIQTRGVSSPIGGTVEQVEDHAKVIAGCAWAFADAMVSQERRRAWTNPSQAPSEGAR